jgi:hypothetical protein
MKRLLLVTLLLSSFFIDAAPKKPNKKSVWHKGTVTFFSGDSLTCQLRFTRKVSEGLIQVMNGDNVRILTVKNVRSFSYYDENKNQVRRFINIALVPDLSTRKHEVFTEYIYGTRRFSILNHKTIGYAENSLQINPFRKKTVVNRSYLLDNKTGDVLPMTKENILLLMADQQEQVMNFIQSSGRKLKTVSDYIALLEYHQSIL